MVGVGRTHLVGLHVGRRRDGSGEEVEAAGHVRVGSARGGKGGGSARGKVRGAKCEGARCEGARCEAFWGGESGSASGSGESVFIYNRSTATAHSLE